MMDSASSRAGALWTLGRSAALWCAVVGVACATDEDDEEPVASETTAPGTSTATSGGDTGSGGVEDTGGASDDIDLSTTIDPTTASGTSGASTTLATTYGPDDTGEDDGNSDIALPPGDDSSTGEEGTSTGSTGA